MKRPNTLYLILIVQLALFLVIAALIPTLHHYAERNHELAQQLVIGQVALSDQMTTFEVDLVLHALAGHAPAEDKAEGGAKCLECSDIITGSGGG